MPRLRVLSLNAWTDHERLDERTSEMVRGILELSPAIVCLQEVSAPRVKDVIHRRLSHRYHILQTNHYELSFPALAYVPVTVYVAVASALVGQHGAASVGDALGSLLRWMQALATRPGTIPAEDASLLMWLSVLALGALLLSPGGIYFFARLALAKTLKPDLMAQTVLVRRSPNQNEAAAAAVASSAAAAAGDDDAVAAIRAGILGWDTAEVVRVQPFPHEIRGYPAPKSVRQWPWYWIQHCLLRPGFMVVRASNGGHTSSSCRDAWVVSTHLTISTPYTDRNDTRIRQVQYLQACLLSEIDAAFSGGRDGKTKAAVAKEEQAQKARVNSRTWLQKRWDDHVAKLEQKEQQRRRDDAGRWKQQQAAKPPLLLVAGDFNAPDHSPEIQWMKLDAFSDVMATATSGSSGSSGSGGSGGASDAKGVAGALYGGGYIDAADPPTPPPGIASVCGGEVVPRRRFLTWDTEANPHTAKDPTEPANRLDYIFAAIHPRVGSASGGGSGSPSSAGGSGGSGDGGGGGGGVVLTSVEAQNTISGDGVHVVSTHRVFDGVNWWPEPEPEEEQEEEEEEEEEEADAAAGRGEQQSSSSSSIGIVSDHFGVLTTLAFS